jgi:hypothetical protein
MSDKKIGIIVSGGHGAGWSTWGDPRSSLDQELAKAIDSNASQDELSRIASKNWPKEYQGGLSDCTVEWVDEGVAFKITEYDGAEGIEFKCDDIWLIAKEQVDKIK